MSRPDLQNGGGICAWLLDRFPGANPRLVEFPSGAWTIDIDCFGEGYVIEYSTRLRVAGVSKMASAVFGWEGFEHAAETAEQLERHLTEIMGAN